MTEKKGEKDCRFIRHNTYVKHSVLIRSDRKLMVNGDSKMK